ncbi:MAG: metal-dependent hydrolase [Asgard group archaeon]|nr:metal-dependent hydrolase [Asgard group archaeon]
MTNRTAHVSIGFILAAAYVPVDFLVINSRFGLTLKETWIFWVIGLLLGILGSEGPDFDQLYGFMSHRDIITHSAIYPGAIFAVAMWLRVTGDETTDYILISSFIPFLLGYSSHLLLDYFPNIDVRKLRDGEFRIKEKKGTFLMHVPFIYKSNDGKERRTLNVKNTERWLLANSFLCLAMAVLLALARYYTNISLPF